MARPRPSPDANRGRRARRGLAAAVGTLLMGGLLAACGGAGGGRPGQVTITLYNGQHPQTTHALVAAFERQTGIHVEVRDGDEGALAQEIAEEGSSTPADVFYSENSPALMFLQGKGLLAPIESSTLTQVPARYDSPGGDWVGVSARVSVLVYNTSQLPASQVPSSVLDLADPRWKGKLALAPTETDFEPVVTSIAKLRGRSAALAWLKGVKANASAHIEPDNETVTSDVNKGRAALGLIDHYYWFRLAAEVGPANMHSAIAYFAPGDPGYVLDVSGAGVLKSSRHAAAAQRLVAFLVSAAGQRDLAASDSFEYPLRPGVAAHPGLKPFGQLRPAPVTVADLGDGSEALRLLQQAQLV
ncbi:MAG: extracellular solute-binding protein [Acidimicrobiales bacterium]